MPLFLSRNWADLRRYCNRVYKAQELEAASAGTARRAPAAAAVDDQDDATPSIYHTLLSLYLTPSPPHAPNLAPALDLLSRHGSRLPASSTLQLIPDGLPVAQLASYFRGRMRAANSAVNESRIETGLRYTRFVAATALLHLGDGIPGGQGGRNRRVVVGEERACGVCHKRLGGSVVAVLPDNAVVHYGCLRGTSRPDASRVASWGRVG